MGIRIEAPKQDGNARFETLKVNLTENTTTTRGVVVDNDGNFYYGTPSPASGSAFPYTGSASILGSLVVSGTISATQGITGSLYGTASWALNALTASYVDAANVVGLNLSRITTGSVTASVDTGINAFLVTSQSIELFKVNSSGSVIHGSGSVSSGSYQTIVGKFNQSSSAEAAFIIGNGTSDSARSNLLFAANNTIDITGSVNISGSTTQIGNNNLLGNTTLSGSIIISGALGTNNPTIKIYGDTQHNGYIRFDPVSTNIDNSISASYIYVSGSTNDLYFTQNGEGFANTTRLRWLEGNLYTGLLHGGLISSASSTTFNISEGSGIIVNLGASLTRDPYPTIKYIEWPNLTNQPLTFRTSSIQTFVGIDDTGNIIQQTTPWNDGQYNTSISIGTVLHQNLSTINGNITYPNVAYGYKQRTYDFIKAFGPLKLSGYTIIPSSSLGLTVTGGTAFADGRNYQVDPNNPSYIVDVGTNVSKIFRYYQSGSTFVQDTNGGLGYTVLDPANYNPNSAGVLTAISPSTPWSNQRVFWYPNSATKGIVVYYGTQVYASQTDAIANLQYETFNETPNTQQNAIYLGAITIKYNATFTNPADFTILPAGIFRSVGGSGGGGGVPSSRLVDLSDVNITSPTNAQPLAYNSSTSKWTNQSSLNIDITGNAATATSSSYAATASFVTSSRVFGPFGANSILSSSYAISSSYSLSSSFTVSSSLAQTASFVTASNVFGPFGSNSILSSSFAVSSSYSLSSSFTVSSSLAQTASYITSSRVFGPFGFDSIQTSSLALTASSADNFTVRQSLTASNALISNTLTVQTIIAQTITSSTDFVTGSTRFGTLLTNTHDFTGSVRITGSLTVTGPATINNLTGSLFGTASWAQNALTASFITASNVFGPFGSNSVLSSSFAVSSSLAQSSSFALTASQAISSSFSTTSNFATSASLAQTASFVTASNVFGPFGSNSILSSSFAISSSLAQSSSFALTASQAISSSFATTASFTVSASFAQSSSFAVSSSFTTTASFAQSASQAISSSFSTTSSFATSASLAQTASFTVSSSFATSASFAQSASQAASSSFSLTASFVNPLRQTVQITGSLALTGSITINTNGENRVLASTFRPAGAIGSNLYIGHAGTTNTGTGVNSSFNTSVGINALDSNTTGYFNTAIGNGALDLNTTGLRNTAVGYLALQSITDGANNTSLGEQSLYLAGGSFNVAIGSLAGANIAGFVTSSIYLGYNASGLNTGISDQTNNEIVIGANAVGRGSNTTTIGNLNTTSTLIRGAVSASAFTGSLFGTASLAQTASFTISSSFATSASLAQTASFTISSSFASTASSADNFVVRQNITASNALITGTLTAQTIISQVITSSTDFVTGSTRFGTLLTNTHQFTGSVSMTGSLTVIGQTTINNLTGSLFGTSSWAQNVLTASFVTASNVFGPFGSNSILTSSFAVSASNSISSSYALSSSFAVSASWAPSAGLSGGTTNVVPLWTSPTTLGASVISQSSGNIGIGTSNPTGKLEINNGLANGNGPSLVVSGSGDIRVTDGGSIFFGEYNYAASTYIRGFDNSAILDFVANGTRMVSMTSTGVGIGNVTSPGNRLEISGSGGPLIRLRTPNTGNSYILYTSGSTDLGYIGYGSAVNNTMAFVNYLNEAVFIGTNSAVVMTVTGSNVGIGISSPSYKLQVAPESVYSALNTGDGFAIYNPTLSGANLILGVNGTGANQGALIQGRAGTTTTFAIQLQPYGGNVGIGINPRAKLDVDGALIIQTNNNLSWGNIYGAGVPTIAGVSGSSAFIAFYPAGSTSGEKVRIDNAGNVGIGITTPEALLHVYRATDPSMIVGQNGTTAKQTILVHYTSGGTGNNGYFSVQSVFQNNAYTDIVLNQTGGNVGIGVTTPAYKLDVNGAARITSSVFLPGLTQVAQTRVVTIDTTTGQLYFTASSAIGGGGLSGGTTNFVPLWTSPTTLGSSVISQSSGNIGISTTPSYKLDIGGSLGIRNTLFADILSGIYNTLYTQAGNIGILLGGSADPGNYYYNTTHYFRDIAGVTRVTIRAASSGRLGINVDPTQVFEAQAPIAVAKFESTVGTSGSFFQFVNTGGNFYLGMDNSTGTNFGGSSAYAGIIYHSGAYPIQFFTSATLRMTLTSAGNFGIGTASPSYKLDVSGSARTFSSQAGGGINIIDLQNTDNTAGVSHVARFGVQQQGGGVGRTLLYAASPDSSNTAGDLTILTENGGNIIATIGKSGTNNTISLYNSGSTVTERIRLHSVGNSFFLGGDVAIGISVPTARLHVSGTTGGIFEVDGAGAAGANALYVNSSGNVGIATASPSYRLDVSGSARVTASLAVGNILPSATIGRIDASNDVVAFSTSDIRFKTNLTPIDKAVEKITTISGYEFDWIPNQEYHGYEGRDVGIIAQEIEKVLPQVVTTRDSGYKAVKYEKIVPLLIQAIKEQQEQIDELRYLLQNKT